VRRSSQRCTTGAKCSPRDISLSLRATLDLEVLSKVRGMGKVEIRNLAATCLIRPQTVFYNTPSSPRAVCGFLLSGLARPHRRNLLARRPNELTIAQLATQPLAIAALSFTTGNIRNFSRKFAIRYSERSQKSTTPRSPSFSGMSVGLFNAVCCWFSYIASTPIMGQRLCD
jgi:hypothetical protein